MGDKMKIDVSNSIFSSLSHIII